MKKFFLITVLLGALPVVSMAQDDDLYFTPKKSVKTEESKPAYYVGSNRDVDEYNRRGKSWSHYQKVGVDEKGNDIIEFKKGNGVYPDSTYIDTTFVGKYYDTVVSQDDLDDYLYTRRMSRWDGFYDPWFYSYRWGYGPYWGYDPFWSYGWYDPYYYGYWGYGYPYYSGFYDPWFYGYPYYGWHRPYYYPTVSYVYHGGPTGTRNHSRGGFAGTGDRTFGNAHFGGTRSARSGSFGNRSNASSQNSVASRGVNLNNGTVRFGGTRSYGNNNSNNNNNNSGWNSNPSRSNTSSGSFGGTRSGGGSFGGGSSSGGSRSGGGGGGGHFGNRR